MAQTPATFSALRPPLRAEPAVMLFALLSNAAPFSHMEKIETLIYLFVLQVALVASLLCSPGTPSHTLELKINSFYLGRGSNGFLIWRKDRNNGGAGCQETRGEADQAGAWESPRAHSPSPRPWASPSETGQAMHGHSPLGTPALCPG